MGIGRLRNHGFMLGKTGWILAPAFDVNPNIDKVERVLNIDDVDNRPSLETVLSTTAFYGLDDERGRLILDEVVVVVDHWQDTARRMHISGADIDLTAGAFSANKAERRKQPCVWLLSAEAVWKRIGSLSICSVRQ